MQGHHKLWTCLIKGSLSPNIRRFWVMHASTYVLAGFQKPAKARANKSDILLHVCDKCRGSGFTDVHCSISFRSAKKDYVITITRKLGTMILRHKITPQNDSVYTKSEEWIIESLEWIPILLVRFIYFLQIIVRRNNLRYESLNCSSDRWINEFQNRILNGTNAINLCVLFIVQFESRPLIT